ncbi:MAG: DUF2155 domain-containing protein [Alphaproteobacteria bacterium HGW-Alphaproteobacteria-2]|nr:MAG: DUF2155 domain-containing protein [Alphaproteobacteria bacterium HGW-Alphaproteobacteria-2]
MIAALAFSLTLAASAAAQSPAETLVAPGGALLRALDRISGALTELQIAPGETVEQGGLAITLAECRYPADDPGSDAFAHLTIRIPGAAEPLFRGWMIASSPALMALDHPRHDVWVIRCNIPEGDSSGG